MHQPAPDAATALSPRAKLEVHGAILLALFIRAFDRGRWLPSMGRPGLVVPATR
jgi:hypothetical protein